MSEPIVFEPVDSFTVNGRGTAFTGPCPVSQEDNIRTYVGRKVSIHGRIYTIRSVETHAMLNPPSKGDPVGIVVDPSEPTEAGK